MRDEETEAKSVSRVALFPLRVNSLKVINNLDCIVLLLDKNTLSQIYQNNS